MKAVRAAAFAGAMLAAYRGELYNLESNFQVVTADCGYLSVGSGQDLALGSMHASKGEKDPKKRILKALEAATAGNAGVAPLFRIVSVKTRKHGNK